MKGLIISSKNPIKLQATAPIAAYPEIIKLNENVLIRYAPRIPERPLL